jgi:hypothetical protein
MSKRRKGDTMKPVNLLLCVLAVSAACANQEPSKPADTSGPSPFRCICGHKSSDHEQADRSGRNCLKCGCEAFTPKPDIQPPKFPEQVYEGTLQAISPLRGKGSFCTVTLQDGRTFQVRSDAKITHGKDAVTWERFTGGNYFAGSTIRLTSSTEFYGAIVKVEMNYGTSKPKETEETE